MEPNTAALAFGGAINPPGAVTGATEEWNTSANLTKTISTS
jgi:hypothetical protein